MDLFLLISAYFLLAVSFCRIVLMCKIMLYSCAVVKYKGERVLANGKLVHSGNVKECAK